MPIQSAAFENIAAKKRPDTPDSAGGGGTPQIGISCVSLATMRRCGGDILAPAFGMTVSAWIAAYLTRMPMLPAPAPGQVTISLMLAMVFAWGFLAARYSSKGILAALGAGALSGLLDILVIGSLLHDVAAAEGVVPAALLWVGGSILLNSLVAGLGGVLGACLPSPRRAEIRWPAVFALILAAATLPLITIGGLVTAYGAGMAVPDWPNSYGYNMFLFPLSQMQAAMSPGGAEAHGRFFEHAHRLMGALVGLTALALAIHMSVAVRAARLKIAAWAIFGAICVQGVLGGLRVTENSIPLATLHGIFAQIVLASMACLAAASSKSFSSPIARTPGAGDRLFSSGLLIALILQLALGALVRQRVDTLVFVHVTMAAVVALLALACGFRALVLHGNSQSIRPLRRVGLAVIVLVLIQLTLGVMALALRPSQGTDHKTTLSALWTTAHQANGALLLATCAVLWLWNLRLFSSEPVPAVEPLAA